MSHRTLARVLSKVAGKSWSEVFNDASGFGLDPLPPAEEVEKVTLKLNACGLDDVVRGW
jgi:hypothetical protein